MGLFSSPERRAERRSRREERRRDRASNERKSILEAQVEHARNMLALENHEDDIERVENERRSRRSLRELSRATGTGVVVGSVAAWVIIFGLMAAVVILLLVMGDSVLSVIEDITA